MVKAYLRYEPAGSFGAISGAANVEFDASGRHVIAGALESVLVWNAKAGELVKALAPAAAASSSSGSGGAAAALPEVTQLARAPAGALIAAGYSDGSVRLWDAGSGECAVTLSGHRGAVTALRFDAAGGLLASGANDTDVIVWDVAAEAGLVRLRGHKGAVTDLAFLEDAAASGGGGGIGGGGATGSSGEGRLVSSSKDGTLRVWDLGTQHCCQVVGGAKGEVWSVDADPAGQRLAAVGADAHVRLFAVRPPPPPPGSALHEQQQQHEQQRRAGGAADAAAEQEQQRSARAAAHDALVPMGHVSRAAAQERAARVRYDPTGSLLGVLAAGKALELFAVRNEDEARRKAKRRRKRKAEKAASKAAKGGAADTARGAAAAAAAAAAGGASDEDDDEAGNANDADALRASDELAPLIVVTAKHKVRSFAFAPPAAGRPKGCVAQVALGLAHNSIEVLDVKADGYAPRAAVEQPGHRADVRALALSSDDLSLLSCSAGGAKLWNPATGACVATLDGGYGLCAMFAPGNRHAVVGTKEGTIEVYDVGAATRVHVEQAHAGPVWGLSPLPDKSGFVSGSADKTVKFWTWAVIEGDGGGGGDDGGSKKKKKKSKSGDGHDADEAAADANANAGGGRRLGLALTRTLETSDDVLAVRVSPDGRLLAVALLDATVRVYFADSLKFFLSLYGHKLPVLSMDISSDSTLLVTGSADKNVKVWGLDFGDCHKSLFAHQDAVTAVAFVRNTHYAFSAGRDRLVKYWDLDRFEMLLELPGHHAEVWALAVSGYGDFLVTAGRDRGLRRWARGGDPFFVEEERERRLESLFEADLEAQALAAERTAAAAAAEEGGGGEDGGAAAAAAAAAAAGRRTVEAVGAADAIVDALDVAANEERKIAEAAAAAAADAEADAAAAAAGAAAGAGPAAAAEAALAAGRKRASARPPPANPLMLGLGPSEYVLRAVAGVRPADLEQALLLLPFADALRLLGYLAGWLAAGAHVELCVRAAVLLLRLHHARLVATPGARATLLALHAKLRPAAAALKDALGFNAAALRHLRRAAGEAAGTDAGATVAAARRRLLGSAA